MIKKALHGLLVAFALAVLPVALRPAIVQEPKVWILIVLAIAASIFQPSYRSFEGSRTKEDRGSAVTIVWSIYLTQLFAVLEAILLRYPESFRFDLLSVFALVCMVSGILLRAWGVKELGRFFSWNVEVQAGQRIVETGPYRFIRHPGYAGPLLTYFMSTLFLHSWYTALAAGIALPIIFKRRIRLEEALLKQHFPEYVAYAQRTKALIPGIY